MDADQSLRHSVRCVFKLKQKSVEIQRNLVSSACLSVFVAGLEQTDVDVDVLCLMGVCNIFGGPNSYCKNTCEYFPHICFTRLCRRPSPLEV